MRWVTIFPKNVGNEQSVIVLLKNKYKRIQEVFSYIYFFEEIIYNQSIVLNTELV